MKTSVNMTQIETLGEEVGLLQRRYSYTISQLASELVMDASDLGRKINGKDVFTSGEIRTVERWKNNLKPIKNGRR